MARTQWAVWDATASSHAQVVCLATLPNQGVILCIQVCAGALADLPVLALAASPVSAPPAALAVV